MRHFMIKMRRNRLISVSLAVLVLDCAGGGTMQRLELTSQSFTGPVVVWSHGRKSTWVSVSITTDSLIGKQLIDSGGTLQSSSRIGLPLTDVDSVLGAKAGLAEWAEELLGADLIFGPLIALLIWDPQEHHK